jgi:excisionase family DNA binding protein
MNRHPLTTGEVAAYCHVTYRTVLTWIESGKLKAYRTPGNHSRIDPQDFLTFLKEYRMPVPDTFHSQQSGNKKVLVVDDDKNMANSIQRVLRNTGNFEIEIAYNGFDAGRKFISFDPDLVILDIRMPGMDGYEVAKNIKETSPNPIKIIAISAFFEQEVKNKIMKCGADICLDKPFNSDALTKAIKELLMSPKLTEPKRRT